MIKESANTSLRNISFFNRAQPKPIIFPVDKTNSLQFVLTIQLVDKNLVCLG